MYYPSGNIFSAACAAFDISMSDMLSPRRTKRLSEARFAAAFYLKYWGNVSTPDIGRMLGNGPKWYWGAQKAFLRYREADRAYRARADRIEELLAGKERAA